MQPVQYTPVAYYFSAQTAPPFFFSLRKPSVCCRRNVLLAVRRPYLGSFTQTLPFPCSYTISTIEAKIGSVPWLLFFFSFFQVRFRRKNDNYISRSKLQ